MEQTDVPILIVDDDLEILKSLKLFLGRYFSTLISEQDPGKIEVILKKRDIGIVLLDMNFRRGIRSGEEGFMWLRKIKEACPDTEVIMITAYGGLELAIRTIKEGAHDFILKPWINDKLLATVMAAGRQYMSNRIISRMKVVQKLILGETQLKGIMNDSKSEPVRRMFEIVRKVAASEANILVLGENGSGKEIVAEMVHQLSLRFHNPLIRIDLGSINENLFEGELFGHVKGAFTDAREDKIGRIEIASGGTLFLDEIANLPLNMQSKLLSVIQNRKVIRIGSSEETKVDFRLICATNRDLNQMVKDGTFREDLLYRINTVEINVPPLRQRTEDITLFLDHFLEFYSNRYGKQKMSYDKELIEDLVAYRWPGNIRELKHEVERAVVLSEGKKLTRDDFSVFVKNRFSERVHGNTLEDIEMYHIIELLKKNGGHINKTASELGISRYTLHRKIKKYEI